MTALRLRLCLAVAAAVGTCAPAEASSLRFDQVFSSRGEPAHLHYLASFTASGGDHRLEVWRDGDRRLKRVTDQAIATYGVHAPADAGYRLTVLDLRRRISTRVDRTSLYRLGSFTDWFDLGHGLRHPQGAYVLAAGTAPPGAPVPFRPCRWYDLTQAGRSVHVCWSMASRLPLLIVPAGRGPVWRITAIDVGPVPATAFVVRDQGFVHNDASSDLADD